MCCLNIVTTKFSKNGCSLVCLVECMAMLLVLLCVLFVNVTAMHFWRNYLNVKSRETVA